MALILPIGSIVAYAGPIDGNWEVANGWLLCDGRSLDRKKNDGGRPSGPYQPLFDALGSSWGGDGVNKFNIPDLRGRFLRGVDMGAGNDPEAGSRGPSNAGGHGGDQVGSVQLDQLGRHAHELNDPERVNARETPG